MTIESKARADTAELFTRIARVFPVSEREALLWEIITCAAHMLGVVVERKDG